MTNLSPENNTAAQIQQAARFAKLSYLLEGYTYILEQYEELATPDRIFLIEKADEDVIAAWTFETLAEAAEFAADSETQCDRRYFYDLDQVVDNFDDLTEVKHFVTYSFAKPQVIVTVSGGVAEVGVNTAETPVEIVDYDNLKDLLVGAEGGASDSRQIILSEVARDFLKRTDPDFYARLQPFLVD